MSLTCLALSYLASAVDASFLILIVEEAFGTFVTPVDPSDRTIFTVAQQAALVFANVEVDIELESFSTGVTSGWSTF